MFERDRWVLDTVFLVMELRKTASCPQFNFSSKARLQPSPPLTLGLRATMVKYTVNERAYALPLLHAAKYPSSEVCGILLADASSTDSETVNITRAVPLFHHWTTLTPMLEVALQQVNITTTYIYASITRCAILTLAFKVDLYATKNKLEIAGWYVANENNTDRSLNEHTIKTIDKISRHNEKAVVFLVGVLR